MKTFKITVVSTVIEERILEVQATNDSHLTNALWDINAKTPAALCEGLKNKKIKLISVTAPVIKSRKLDTDF